MSSGAWSCLPPSRCKLFPYTIFEYRVRTSRIHVGGAANIVSLAASASTTAGPVRGAVTTFSLFAGHLPVSTVIPVALLPPVAMCLPQLCCLEQFCSPLICFKLYLSCCHDSQQLYISSMW